jgi:Carbohydrate esterase, sialic acid-specific acetylesterase
MRKIIFAMVAMGVSYPAVAQINGGGTIDPYALPVATLLNYNGTLNLAANPTNLRSASLQSPNTGIRNLVLRIFGQSNAQNYGPTCFTIVNGAKLDMLNIYDGGIYAAADPLLGTPTPVGKCGDVATKLGDSLITANLFDRVLIVPGAIGATFASDWDTGVTSRIIPTSTNRLKAKGWTVQTNVTDVILWMQGEQECANGVGAGAYTTSMNSVISKSTAAGFSGTWFIASETWTAGTSCANIETAQAGLVNHPGVWAGPNVDARVGTACTGAVACRQADNTHLSDQGQVDTAADWKAALHLFGAPF